MAFNPPSYNLSADLWVCFVNAFPADGAPTYTGRAVQKYIYNKVQADAFEPLNSVYWHQGLPFVQIRTARTGPFSDPHTVWDITCVECPSGSGQYYRVYWQDVQHEGFPNEYALLVCKQCTDSGDALPPPGASRTPVVGTNDCGD